MTLNYGHLNYWHSRHVEQHNCKPYDKLALAKKNTKTLFPSLLLPSLQCCG